MYSPLSRVYDIVFPENKKATVFLTRDIKPSGSVLDLACGTGIYSHALAVKGYSVYSVDFEEEMIKSAKRKYKDEPVNFTAGDMLEIDTMFGEKSFDLVFCIGNSLVHLSDRESVKALIEKVYSLLNIKGVFVVQIVNFDRILKYGIDSLPLIERKKEGIKFVRKYEFTGDPEYIIFKTELFVKGEKTANSVRLLALKSKVLIRIFRSAGFSNIQLFGDYEGSEYTVDSPAAVLKGYK